MDAPTRDTGPDLEGLARHVRTLLDASLREHVQYHDLAHTFDDVVPAADRLSIAEGLPPERRWMVRAAALLHDTGFIEGPADHERSSARIARDVLPRFGFEASQVDEVADLILATRIGHVPGTLSEAVIMDADLDVLGRPDFWAKNLRLRHELAAEGIEYDEVAWWRGQLRFLSRHSYRTESARKSRGPGKRQNIRLVQEHLKGLLEERRLHGSA